MKRRVVVTGMGALNPVGNDVESTWKGLMKGLNPANLISKFDTKNCQTKIAFEIHDFDIHQFIDKKDLNKLDLVSSYALVVANEALKESNLLNSSISKNRIGVIWGTGNGGAQTYDAALKEYFLTDRKKFSPYFVPKVLLDTSSGIISIKHGLKGVNYTTVAACASGTNAIVDAFNYIQWGKADAIIAGASDAPICEHLIGGFNALKALSTLNDDPKMASRPFDESRDGFVMGEGAACLVLETLESALERGAQILAEIVGGGINADAYHMTAGHPEGEGAAECMQLALDEAEIKFSQIDYLNAHATSTPVGDLAESKAIVKMTGELEKSPWIGATKSMTGHLMGAAGALESMICVMAVKNDEIPPTLNLSKKDPELNEKLRIVGNQSIKTDVNYAMCNNFGFGGHNCCIVFKKYKR